MQRSKTQVMFNHLPGQVFRHENGLIAQVQRVATEPSYEINSQLVFDALDRELHRWTHQTGFRPPLVNPDRYSLVEPVDEVVYDLWPLNMRCKRCGVIKIFNDITDIPKSPRCGRNGCPGHLEQLPFLQVHQCGELKPLLIQRCNIHGFKSLVLDDPGNFADAQLRCLDCGVPVKGLGYRGCTGCNLPGDRYMRSLPVRAPGRFFTQSFPLVTLKSGPLQRLKRDAAGPAVVLATYLDDVRDLEEELDAAASVRKGSKYTPEEIELMRQGMASLPEALREQAMKDLVGGGDDKWSEIEDQVGAHAAGELGISQRLQERAMIFSGAGDLRVRRLEHFEEIARRLGQQATVRRLQGEQQALLDAGFARAVVVENFPIALVAYGWTRLSNKDSEARLNPFPQLKNDKTPLYVSTSNTEAVFLELDPVRVCAWLAENDLLTEPAPTDPREARLLILRENAAEGAVAQATSNLCHTVSHSLIRNLGELSGFGEDTMAEYLIPQALTIGLYANVHQEFTLGALVSLVEHHLSTWLRAAVRGTETCTWDPRCSEHDGACANCLHLAFGCEHRNQDLDRSLLYGTAEPTRATAVAHGYWA
ncbi:hypothetical protein NBH00_18470 [Paraconexibacter antarcticus]|uniref:DUF1998 domain-containing protein n=1 Tax=Paraconexibacter antarcticus TaxID=2949664 RepID=A0ABY5DQ25_9ACTN|nr:hypothetical protein [Paraconexibacter antarcticus]UTI63328.1 hypothetical protein NBH00_18470 [Paraconexibacter antarcticus]